VFLVEGDSAGGSAKLARDKQYQAILPLRGKVLNTFEVERDRLFANTEIHDIAVAIGVDPHHSSAEADLKGLRYSKIIIMADADVDGSHIKVLLLTLFFRHFPALIEHGHVCVASPPLYRIDVPPSGKRPARKLYALDDGELEGDRGPADEGRCEARLLVGGTLQGPGRDESGAVVGNHDEPGNPARAAGARRARRTDEAQRMFAKLMGKAEAASRREWMEQSGHSVEVDV
jgi:topoisomerase-4 subunit B